MSYATTKTIASLLNGKIKERYCENDPVELDIEGRPNLHILSFEPLAYEEYGTFRNRAPHLAGSMALRGLITAPDYEGGARVYIALQAGIEGYGFGLNESNIPVLNKVVSHLGYSFIRFSLND